MIEGVSRESSKADKARALARWFASREAIAATLGAVSPDGELDESLVSAMVFGLSASGVSRRDAEAVAARIRRADREARGGPVVRLAGEEEGPSDVEGPGGILYTLPGGYYIADDGALMRRGGEDRPDVVVAHRVIVVSARWSDEETGREVLDLSWQCDHGWRTETVARATAMDAREIVQLANLGAPVASVSSSEVVRFFRAQAECLPNVAGVAVARSGWVERDYVAGGRCLLGGAPVRVVGDDGARQLARSVGTAGTWDGWLDTLRPVADRPRVLVAVWAAVAAAMLRPLGVSGGIVLHWVAGSSQGKTTALQAGWSVWGAPDSEGIGSWDATAKSIEERAGYSCDMPTVLDETSHIPDRGREAAARLVYAMASGRGRGRGTRSGSDAIKRYRTAVLSSGEAPLTAWCQLEGVAARTLELHGAPCASAEQSRSLVWGLAEHHGHLGPRVVDRLARMDWTEARARYQASVGRWAGRTQAGGIAPRLGAVLALLEAAGRVCASLGVPGDVDATMAYLLGVVEAQAKRADLGYLAWELLVARLAEHADQICGEAEDGRQIETRGGVIGARIHRDEVAVIARVATEWLTRVGIDPTTARDRMESDQRIRQERIRLPGCRPRCWVVKMYD